MLTTLKSGTTVQFSGIPLHICTDVEVEVEDAAVAALGSAEADALGIPCTLRHHEPPHSVAPGTSESAASHSGPAAAP